MKLIPLPLNIYQLWTRYWEIKHHNIELQKETHQLREENIRLKAIIMGL